MKLQLIKSAIVTLPRNYATSNSRFQVLRPASTFTVPHFMNVDEAERHWIKQLRQANIPEAKSSIQHILAHILGLQSVRNDSFSRQLTRYITDLLQ